MISFKYDWEQEYVSAILETDNKKLPERADAAVAKMRKRINEFSGDCGGSTEELKALTSAMTGLLKMRTERLGEIR